MFNAIAAHGGVSSQDPRAFRLVQLPEPIPGPHDLLVRVEALAVNPVDTKVRASLPAPEAPTQPGAVPRLLGWDAAGVVEACGAAVRGLGPGDAVWFAGDISRQGCYGERVLVEAAICGHRPPKLSAAEAAALPLTGITAWEALFERLGLDPEGADAGRSLLILGEQLGADHVLNHQHPLAPQLAPLGYEQLDAIANFSDTDAYWPVMAELIRPQGAIVAIVGNRSPLDLNLLKAKSASFHWEFMFTRPQFQTADRGEQGAILARLAQLLEAGELCSTLTTELTPINPTNLARAHGLLESGRTIGKIVLTGWD